MERNYAEMFVDIDKYITNHENAFRMERTAYISDIKSIATLSGRRKEPSELDHFQFQIQHDKNITTADAHFIKFAENLLTGHIGTAPKILISRQPRQDKLL
jgi:hypothetical protein